MGSLYLIIPPFTSHCLVQVFTYQTKEALQVCSTLTPFLLLYREVKKGKGTKTKALVTTRLVAQSHEFWFLIWENVHGSPLPSLSPLPHPIYRALPRYRISSARSQVCGKLLRELVTVQLSQVASPFRAHVSPILSALFYFGHNIYRY